MPDGRIFTERQDIGDGDGGVLEAAGRRMIDESCHKNRAEIGGAMIRKYISGCIPVCEL